MLACRDENEERDFLRNFGTPEGDLYPFCNPEDHGKLIEKYALAWARLMHAGAKRPGGHLEARVTQGRKPEVPRSDSREDRTRDRG
jgi:hypothetical protein